MSQSLRILLVADDPEVIRKIGQGLQRQDSGLILIEGADTLHTARRRLGSGAYDLALVDLSLGQDDGLHLLSDLLEISPELPLVAVAADGAAPDMLACLAHGAQDRVAPEALESAGLLDRLQSAAARAGAGRLARRRSQLMAASLAATGDLAWHYEGAGEVWLAAADPAAWQLPGPECSESLDDLRARIHPDDRETVLRRIGELLETDQPWQLEARVKVGGGAYRWCTLRGHAHLDPQGRLERASGMLSDAQRQQKALRDIKQARRFLRAVFDSSRAPQAVLDSAAVITECNQAWLALDDPACHAGKAFGQGSLFADGHAASGDFGDLDLDQLARGIRKVLGGVADHFSCEYGDGQRRWQISVTPLLNPGIAGAVVSHEEITAIRREEGEAHAKLEALERDLFSISGPFFRVAADFVVLAANEDGQALGRAPQLGRDVLRVLPRVHADAVGNALAAVSAGARAAVRDSRPRDGQVFRWLVSSRGDPTGNGDGFLVHGVDVSDLAAQAEAAPDPGPGERALAALRGELEQERQLLASARATLAAMTEESDSLGARLAEEKKYVAGLREALASAEARLEELGATLEQARRAAEDARRREADAEQEGQRLTEALEGERTAHGETVAALSKAEHAQAALYAGLERAQGELRTEIESLVGRLFTPLLDQGGSRPDAVAAVDRHKSKAR
jgi:CheY-like chemotaxis protein